MSSLEQIRGRAFSSWGAGSRPVQAGWRWAASSLRAVSRTASNTASNTASSTAASATQLITQLSVDPKSKSISILVKKVKIRVALGRSFLSSPCAGIYKGRHSWKSRARTPLAFRLKKKVCTQSSPSPGQQPVHLASSLEP